MKRVAGYVRLSKETDETTSPERQRRAIRRLCKERGWKLTETFEDIDRSAFDGRRRPSFDRLMSRLGEFDAVAFWKLDRLARSSVEAGQIAERCKAEGVDLVATDMDIDTTSAGGKFIYSVLAASAEMESARLSERSRDMIAYKRSRQEHIGTVPQGFMLVDKRLVKDPRTFRLLEDAAKRYVKGETFNAIAKDLGVDVTTLHRQLHRDSVQEALPPKLREDLRTAIAMRRQQRVPTSKQSLLGGIAACKECGKGLTMCTTHRPGKVYRSYGCPDGHVGVSATFLDQYVGDAVLGAVDTTKLVNTIRARRKAGRARTRRVSEIEARIAMLDEMLVAGKVTPSRYERMNDSLGKQLDDARRGEREAHVYLPEEIARDLTTRWPDLSVAGRRQIIVAVLEGVVVGKAKGRGKPDPDRVRLIWRA